VRSQKKEEPALDFAKVLRCVVSFFEREGFRYAVVGAFGLAAYGLARATQDLDFITVVESQSKLLLFLESLGYNTEHASTGYSTHLHREPEMGRLDFIYVSGATSIRLFEEIRTTLTIEDLSVPVPKPEHLIAMKVLAIKNDPERTFREMADIQFLLGLPEIDEAEVKEYFRRQDLLEVYFEIKGKLENN
jgi:hypothetical protein